MKEGAISHRFYDEFPMMLTCSLTLGSVHTSVHLTNRLSFSFFFSLRTIRTIRQHKPARRCRRQAPTKWLVYEYDPFAHTHTYACIKYLTYLCLHAYITLIQTVTHMHTHCVHTPPLHTGLSVCECVPPELGLSLLW